MSHYETALLLSQSNITNAWSLGSELLDAIEEEGRTIREFVTELYGPSGLHKEDTFGRYVQANRLKRTIHEPFMDKLEITWWAEGWKWLEADGDIEDLMDTMFEGLEDGKSIAWFRGKRAEATGSTTPLHVRLANASRKCTELRSLFESIDPLLTGLIVSMNYEKSEYTEASLELMRKMAELDDLADLLMAVSELEKK